MSTPLQMHSAGPLHRCPLCGHGFDRGVEKCGGCPMHGGCGTLCCPGCGYSYAERSATLDGIGRVARALRRLFAPGRDGRGEAA